MLGYYLLFVLFLGALVVDDRHLLGGDEGDAVLLGPLHAALQGLGQEDARHVQNGLQRFVGEFHLIIRAVGGVANGF